jgi:hypothetical protein
MTHITDITDIQYITWRVDTPGTHTAYCVHGVVDRWYTVSPYWVGTPLHHIVGIRDALQIGGIWGTRRWCGMVRIVLRTLDTCGKW